MGCTLETAGLLLTSAFETGNARRIRRRAPNHYLAEVAAEAKGYHYYFSLRVAERRRQSRRVTLEVRPDPELSDEGARDFYGDLNDGIWYTKAGMTKEPGRFTWLPEPNLRGEGSVLIHRDRYVIRFDTVPGDTIWLTNVNPLPYTTLTGLLLRRASENAGLLELRSLGRSVQGREVHLVEVGQTERPAILIIAGQHATEFAGQWAAWGIIQWLSSADPSAAELRRRYRFYLVPQINPDGNVAGKPLTNAEGINLYGPHWREPAGESEPSGQENRLLLRLVREHPPVLHLNFHGYCGPRAWGDRPYEGCYVPLLEEFRDTAARERQRALDDHLLWHTHAGSQHHGLLHAYPGAGFDAFLARSYGTPSLLYEPLDGRGPWTNMRTGVSVLMAAIGALEGTR